MNLSEILLYLFEENDLKHTYNIRARKGWIAFQKVYIVCGYHDISCDSSTSVK